MKSFNETQMFTKWYIWLFFVGILILTNYTPISIMVENDAIFVHILQSSIKRSVIPLIVIGFILSIRLKTSIDMYSINIYFFPLVRKKIRWEKVKEVKIISYNPYLLLGRGIRSSSTLGTVYNISGSKGLFLKLENGKKYLIGTQKADELKIYLLSIEKLPL